MASFLPKTLKLGQKSNPKTLVIHKKLTPGYNPNHLSDYFSPTFTLCPESIVDSNFLIICWFTIDMTYVIERVSLQEHVSFLVIWTSCFLIRSEVILWKVCIKFRRNLLSSSSWCKTVCVEFDDNRFLRNDVVYQSSCMLSHTRRQ
jgi:hypothetical protein